MKMNRPFPLNRLLPNIVAVYPSLLDPILGFEENALVIFARQQTNSCGHRLF